MAEQMTQEERWELRKAWLTRYATDLREYEDPVYEITQWVEHPGFDYEDANRISIGCIIKRAIHPGAKSIIAVDIYSEFRPDEEQIVKRIKYHVDSVFSEDVEVMLLSARKYAVMERYLVGYYEKHQKLRKQNPPQYDDSWPQAENRL